MESTHLLVFISRNFKTLMAIGLLSAVAASGVSFLLDEYYQSTVVMFATSQHSIGEQFFEETKKILDKQYVQLNEILVRDVTLPPTIKDAIERKLKQEQESLEYEFRLVTADKEAQKVRIEAQGKADANAILSASLCR